MNITKQIQQWVKKENKELGKAPDWFFDEHLLGVEYFAKILLKKLPDADEEIVLLGVWLHDLQRIEGIEGDHEKIGAIEAEKVLKQCNYNPDRIALIKKIIESHSCKKVMPDTVEGKILASADAMSHYINDFYLRIATTGQKNPKEFKRWALEKLNRDYNKKIHFDFARKIIKNKHDTIIKFLKQ